LDVLKEQGFAILACEGQRQRWHRQRPGRPGARAGHRV